MSITLSAFPTLTSRLLTASGFSMPSPIKFSYIDCGKRFVLERSIPSNDYNEAITFKDSRKIWHPDFNNLIIDFSLSFTDTTIFFGTAGLLPRGSKIGIGVIWADKESGVRGSSIISSFDSASTKITISKSLTFDKSTLKGTLDLRFVLFVQKYDGMFASNGSCYATKLGTILGDLFECKIIIEGDGSSFPIKEVSELGKPLWWVECNFEPSPLEVPFDENSFCLYLNIGHKEYKELHLEDGNESNAFFLDIVASVTSILITKAMDSEFSVDIRSGDQLEEGSVGSVVHYMLDKLGIGDSLEPEILANEIRSYLMVE